MDASHIVLQFGQLSRSLAPGSSSSSRADMARPRALSLAATTQYIPTQYLLFSLLVGLHRYVIEMRLLHAAGGQGGRHALTRYIIQGSQTVENESIDLCVEHLVG
eukprot:scaffold59603_cov35-Tisochrysis_lutea.AAC.4